MTVKEQKILWDSSFSSCRKRNNPRNTVRKKIVATIFRKKCVDILKNSSWMFFKKYNVQSGTETMNQIFNWKKFSFLSVNHLEILHASTYDILVYIYKVKKSRRMATLTYRHFGNPGRHLREAHYNIVHKKAWLELLFRHSTIFNVQNHSHALQCVSSRPHAAAAGSCGLAAAIFFTLYI